MFFTLSEIIDIVIITLVLGYIFKDVFRSKQVDYYEDPIRFYKQESFSSFKTAILITAPAIILHELAHKFMAIAFSMTATLKAAYMFLLFGLVLKLLNFGLIFFVPAYVSWGCENQSCALILQSNPWIPSVIAFAGPAMNSIIWLTCYFMLKRRNIRYQHLIILTKRINGFLFILNMLPIPGFDGWHVYSGIVQSITQLF